MKNWYSFSSDEENIASQIHTSCWSLRWLLVRGDGHFTRYSITHTNWFYSHWVARLAVLSGLFAKLYRHLFENCDSNETNWAITERWTVGRPRGCLIIHIHFFVKNARRLWSLHYLQHKSGKSIIHIYMVCQKPIRFK